MDSARWWIQAFIYLFISPLLAFTQLFLFALFNLSIHLSISASSLTPSLSLSLPLFLYKSAPLRVIYGFISSRSFCQNKITICAIEQKLDGFGQKKKGVRKERTRNCLPFTDFRSCCSKSEVNTSQENKEVCVSLSLYIYTRVCVCVCVCKSSISLCKIFYDVIYYCDPSEIILICRFGV